MGTVIVKRLSAALKDGNTIRAVVRATGINQDGKTPGVTLPSSDAQAALIKAAYASAGLDFEQTMLVEAHGTGTKQGDAIEARGIAQAFAPRSKDRPLYIGSVKASIGHLEGAAGVAGVIKAVLALENGIIPPQANFEKPNPKIRFDAWNLHIARQATPWPCEGLRRVSINSFGVGGTNAHAILDDAYHFLKETGMTGRHHTAPQVPSQTDIERLIQKPDLEAEESMNVHDVNDSEASTIITNGYHSHRQWQTLEEILSPPQLIGISSFDEEGVERNAKALAGYVQSKLHALDLNSDIVRDFAFTLHKRSKLGWRSTLSASTRAELAHNLAAPQHKPIRARGSVSVAFVFTGQGAQYANMGRELYGYPTFRRSLEEASSFFQSLGAEWSLLDELARNDQDSQVHQPWLAQPSCTAIQVAMVELLESWGITPSRVVGHSSGEIAAAYAAGKLNRESAWRTAYYRGVVSNKQTSFRGSMAAVALSQADAQARLDLLNSQNGGKSAVVACINSARNCTVSGDEEIITSLCECLQAESIFARKLNVNKAYHSHHMHSIADEYQELLEGISQGDASKCQMFSTVTGQQVEEDFLDGKYWVSNLVSPVRFSDGLSSTLFRSAQKGQASLRVDSNAGNIFVDTILEIGAHGALQSAIKDTLSSQPGGSAVTSHAVLNRSKLGLDSLLAAVGHLWCRGHAVDLQNVNDSWNVGHEYPAQSLLVDLPGYIFNHSQKLWYESRLSRNHRLRQAPRHDLFGAPVADWNRETPRWRGFLRLGEQPWLRDHLVTNSYVYPGVGYIIAAVEAVRQIADAGLQVTGFRLKDISIKRALIVPDTKEGIEFMVSMQRVDDSSIGVSSSWRRFSITSYNPVADDWSEHATGTISIDYDVPTGPVDDGKEAREEAQSRRKELADAESRCQGSFNLTKAYENMATVGLKFGPLFRNGSETSGTGNCGGAILGKVTVPDIGKAMPKEYISPHLIHPAVMDSMMHFALGAIMDLFGGESLQGPAVPTFIKEVWMSTKLNPQPGTEYRVHGRTERVAFEKYDNDVLAWDSAGEGVLSITGIRATPLDSADQQISLARDLCHELSWVPCIDTVTLSDVQSKNRQPREDELTVEWVRHLQLATMLLIHDALRQLESEDVQVAPEGHLARYFSWLKQLDSWMQEDKVSGITKSEFDLIKNDKDAKQTLYHEIQEYKAEGRLAYRMGSNIVSVLKKEVDPLHLMFGQDDILDHVYADLVDLGDLPTQQDQYLRILAENRTNLHVLEIGAGTGSSTRAIVETLAPVGEDGKVLQSSVARYTYTDISAAFFEKAREKFKAHHGIMDYKVLDAEKDVSSQGFDLGSYDLIVAQNVIHATADLNATLTNLRKLLKPGGRFLLQEGVRQDYFWSALAFGQLPGWWLGVESTRKWSPFISAPQWDEHFKASGFGGVELEMSSSQDGALHTQSLLLTRAVDNDAAKEVAWKQTAIITSLTIDEAHDEMVLKLQTKLARVLRTQQISVLNINQLRDADLSQTLCISLIEIEKPVLAHLTAEEYEGIRQMLTVCKGLLWLTGDTVESPENGMATGLIRTVRWERDLDSVNLVTMAVAEPKPDIETLTDNITTLCEQQFGGPLGAQEMNGEFTLSAGKFTTSRLKESAWANEFLAAKFSTPKPTMTPWKDAGRPVKLSSSSPGLLNKLEWVTDDIYDRPLDPTHVEFEVKAMGLNFRDLMIAMGGHYALSEYIENVRRCVSDVC